MTSKYKLGDRIYLGIVCVWQKLDKFWWWMQYMCLRDTRKKEGANRVVKADMGDKGCMDSVY